MSIFNFWKTHGVLGINARNLLYHFALNKKQGIKMADDKLKTKSFLSTRGINVPKLFGKISKPSEIDKFDFDILPQTFVHKPTRGYGGEGIWVLQRAKEGTCFEKINGTPFSMEELKIHISDILEGRFSLGGFSDDAFFEQKLVLHHSLEHLVPYGGLPDVRIIFYNQVPVMAMLRLPTKESGGTANVHSGGVGVGIDLATGKTTYATQYNKFIDEIPDVGSSHGIQVPFFDEMLLMGAKIQGAVDLGYLAVDLVPDEHTGPTLLEMNARAGLMVQVANRHALRKRLIKIKGTKVGSAERGVQIGKDLFAEKKSHKPREDKKDERAIVGLLENVEILLPHGSLNIIARISPDSERTYLDEQILSQLRQSLEIKEDAENPMIKYILADERHRTIPVAKKFTEDYQMIIGAKNLTNVLIDPNKELEDDEEKPIIEEKPEPTLREKLLSYDQRLTAIDSQIPMLYYFRPTNLDEEKKKFFEDNKYNPQFKYRKLKFLPDNLLAELNTIYIDANLPGADIFIDKKKEIKHKLDLLAARGTSDFTEKSQILYTSPDKNLLYLAEEEAEKFTPENENATVSSDQLVDIFNEQFAKFKIEGWSAKEVEIVADCLAQKKKQNILVRRGAIFSPQRVEKLLLHEFFTHVFTTLNGDQQPYNILRLGTAKFLETQEGLAIYNQTHFANPPREDGASKSALLYVAVCYAMKKSFAQTFAFLKKKNLADELAWQLTLKAKRGLGDTSKAGGFTKDLLYFQGYHDISEFVKNGGDLSRLYIGKFNLSQLEMIEKLPAIKPPYLLPTFISVE